MTTRVPRSHTGIDDHSPIAGHRLRLSVLGWVKCLAARNVVAASVLPEKSPRKPAEGASTARIIEAPSREFEYADETARSAVEGLGVRRTDAASTASANPSCPATLESSERGRHHDFQAGLEAIKAQLRALLSAQPASRRTAGDTTSALLEKHVKETRGGPAGSVLGQQTDRTPADPDVLSRGQQRMSLSIDMLQEQVTVLGDRLSALDTVRLGTIEKQMDAIRSELEAAKSQNGIARLEMRMAELGRAVEAVLAAAKAPIRPASLDLVSRLENRIDNVFARLDRLIDGSVGGVALKAMQAEIGQIREILAGRDLLAALEAQIAGLSGRLDTDRSVPVTGLEETVARLSVELERAIPRLTDFEEFEARVRKSHERMAESLRESVEMVRSAVGEVARKVGGDDLAGDVNRDLGDLRRTVDAADARTQQALRSIQSTLAQIVERLGRLEAERNDEDVPARQIELKTGTHGATGDRSHNQTNPSPLRSSWQGAARSIAMESGRPDLAALRELARSAARGEYPTAGDRKADFIAAARRAARAAAERKESIVEGAAGGKVEVLDRIRQADLGRGRTVAAVAAGLMIAMAAIHPADKPSGNALSLAEGADRRLDPAGGGGDARIGRAVVEQSRRTAAQPKSVGALRAFASAAPECIGTRFDKSPLRPPAHPFVRGGSGAALLPMDDAIGPVDLRRAAAAGNPNAVSVVAARDAEGRVVPRDLAEADQWCQLAAEQGVTVARYRLASPYELWQGLSQDPQIAAVWYRRAAEQVDTGAMHNLGVMLSEGVGGAPDYAEALRWFHAAAGRDVAESQYNPRAVYDRSLGTTRDIADPHQWFALAARDGDEDAGAQRESMLALLSSVERTKALGAVVNPQAAPEKVQGNQMAALLDAWRGLDQGIRDDPRRSLVFRIQTLLAEQRYDSGPPGGFERSMTRQVVLAFQRNTGLSETGAINSDMAAELAHTPG